MREFGIPALVEIPASATLTDVVFDPAKPDRVMLRRQDGDGRWSNGDKTAQFGQKGDLPVVGDFNGDGIEEIAVFRAGQWIIDSNGNHEIDAGDRVIQFGQAGDKPIAGDFDGDGTDEPAVFRPGGK